MLDGLARKRVNPWVAIFPACERCCINCLGKVAYKPEKLTAQWRLFS